MFYLIPSFPVFSIFYFHACCYNSALPGALTMVVTPMRSWARYFTEEIVEFVCQGDVGFPFHRDAFSWQWRHAYDTSDWIPYPYPDRSYEQALHVTPCHNVRVARLKHVVVAGDHARTFRCLATRDRRHPASVTIFVKRKTN